LNIGYIGLGRVGLPCALAFANKGHTVYGYDSNDATMEWYSKGISNLYEPFLDDVLRDRLDDKSLVLMESIQDVVDKSEIIFVAVQTPHPPELDGSQRFNHVRKDFDYSFLIAAIKEILSTKAKKGKIVLIASTVLPGTIEEQIYPLFCETKHKFELCYSPLFIAMGQSLVDFFNPEFTLIGSDVIGNSASRKVRKLFNTMHKAPKLFMSYTEAEMVKVFYNTYIGFKIVFSNMIMQMSDHMGANCDTVTETLCKAHRRIVSPKYMKAGMADGGVCHPRDNLALANFSEKTGCDYNIFDDIMTIREKQTEWLARKAMSYNLPIIIMGKTYKVNTNLTIGSPSILLANILKEFGVTPEEIMFYDPEIETREFVDTPYVYIIGVTWPQFESYQYTKGSFVIDPWGFIKSVPEGVTLVRLGRTTR
jgi:UDPglucose 6-dehydrogenase